MKNLEDKLKELFGADQNPISEETIVKMKVLLSQLIEEKMAEKDVEIAQLKETAEKDVQLLQAEKEDLMKVAQAYGDSIQEELAEKAEEYSKYVVEKFIAENQEKLIEGDEYKRMKTVFDRVKSLFEEQFFSLDFDAAVANQVAELQEQIASQKQEFSELFEQFINTKTELENMQFANLFEAETKDLPDTQKEAIAKLMEHINCKDLNEYKSAVNLLIEQVKNTKTSLEEKPAPKKEDDVMSKYTRLL
jgi:hypothetical protein